MHPDTNAAPHTVVTPHFPRMLAPSHGPTANATLNDIVYKPMYSPRLSGGAISAAYAELPGIRIISPNVQITTAANTPAVFPNGAIPTSAYEPNPTAYRNAPSISVCLCVQCAMPCSVELRAPRSTRC